MSKEPKLTVCKHCGQQIAASAKVCPHCGGKNKKPFYKKVWFWILVAVVLIAALGSGGNRSASKKTGEVNKKDTVVNNTQNTTEAVQTEYHVGDILHDGNMDIVYVSSGDYTEDNQFSQPAAGKKYVFLKLAFINTSDKTDSSISSLLFHGYADGYAVDQYYGGDDDFSATLSAGRSTIGCVYFEVPVDAKEIDVEYESNVFTSEKIKFAFDGNKDSGFTLEKNTAATEGALHVGETLEGKTLNIQYLSCFEDSSNNMFITPKEGYHYITCEFEFENVSSSDVTVSYFSFDCFADGVSCDGVYFRDDNISATLSSGRKAKGTVTFEVPMDAQVVEVEYLTNYWTSNRVVFNATVS